MSALLLCLTLGSLPRAQELAALSGIELADLCRGQPDAPLSSEGLACAAYIRGFIEGSTDIRFGTSAETPQESFSERAYRTRIGGPRAAEPRYCLENTVSLSQFVAQLLAHIDERGAPETASAALYGTLARFHRCNP